MKIYVRYVSIIVSFLLFFCVAVRGVSAASLSFDKTTVNVNAGDTFQVAVTVDAGSDAITSVDAYILYNSSLLQASSVGTGSFFPTVLNDISTSRVYVAGLVDNPTDSKTGTGTVATLTFKALQSGTATLTYNCGSGTESSQVIKNDINATNVISCSSNGTSTITIGAGSAVATATPAAGSTTTTSGGVTELPRTGILDNIIRFAVPGFILVLVGGALKLFLQL